MSLEKLQAILKANKQQIEREREQPPEECPYDGAPLQVRDGVRNCPMGDYRWTG